MTIPPPGEDWPPCCDGRTTFVSPVGIAEIRSGYPDLEGTLLGHLVYNMRIPAGSAARMLETFRRDVPPTVFLFQCSRCEEYQFVVSLP